jgi:hypothetical protein
LTPPEELICVRRVMPHILLDPCSHPNSQVGAEFTLTGPDHGGLDGLSLDAPSALLDPTDRIDTFSPLAGVQVEPGSEITIVSSVPFGTALAGCSP